MLVYLARPSSCTHSHNFHTNITEEKAGESNFISIHDIHNGIDTANAMQQGAHFSVFEFDWLVWL